MIIVIRISGLVEVPTEVNETLFRMRLRRKYSAILLRESKENQKLLQSVRNFVAFGPISKDSLVELLDKRGMSVDKKKVDAKKAAELLEKKDLSEIGLKPFFRLHSPRRGIKSKVHYPKGVLGDNEEKINDLLGRML